MKIAREGIPYITVPIGLALILLVVGYWYIAIGFLVIAGFMAFFFRDPHRTPPTDSNVIVSPADGRVMRVSKLSDREDSSFLISIFLSPLNVHINRAPIAGKITDVAYTRGKFLIASNNNASLVNEQNSLTIEGSRITVVCKQIAGILARRIVCWKHKGEQVRLGERFGLIKFSSRTDLILPPNVEVLVEPGMKVKGGITVMGKVV